MDGHRGPALVRVGSNPLHMPSHYGQTDIELGASPRSKGPRRRGDALWNLLLTVAVSAMFLWLLILTVRGGRHRYTEVRFPIGERTHIRLAGNINRGFVCCCSHERPGQDTVHVCGADCSLVKTGDGSAVVIARPPAEETKGECVLRWENE